MLNYSANVLFNSFQLQREFDWVEKEAARIFTDFFNQGDYGRKLVNFYFYLYVEEQVDFGRHRDGYYTEGKSRTIYTAAHLQYNYFIAADNQEKLKITLNVLLWLIQYCSNSIKIPKDFLIQQVIEDYTSLLQRENILLSAKEKDSIFIKATQSIHFDFIVTRTYEGKPDELGHNLNDLESWINNQLARDNFNSNIRKFQIGYELFDFSGKTSDFFQANKNYKRYGTQHRTLLVVKQFDVASLVRKTREEQFEVLREAILNAIEEVGTMKRKPKNFNLIHFKNRMTEILQAYKNNNY